MSPDFERIAREKDAVGRAAAALVEPGMLVGLGSGSTAARFVVHLAERCTAERLAIRTVATSPATASLAADLGMAVLPYESLPTLGRLDLTADGADEVAPDGWVVKGGGGAHRRERVVAEASDRFVVIVDSTKLVDRIHAPIPMELAPDDVNAVVASLTDQGVVRTRDGWPPSPDGGVIADYIGPVLDPAALATRLSETPGVLAHGLFAPDLVGSVIVGRGDSTENLLA